MVTTEHSYQHPFSMLRQNALNFPRVVALRGQKLGERSSETLIGLTWPEALERVQAYALYFRSLGIQKGDRIGLQARNQIAWPLADWAMMAAGIVSVPIYVQSSARDVDYIIKEADLKLLLVDDEEAAFQPDPIDSKSQRQMSLSD